MKLISFQHKDAESYGVVNGRGIVDCKRRLGSEFPDLCSVLRKGAPDRLREFISQPADHKETEVEILPPILAPHNVFGIGGNYKGHLKEAGVPVPKYPILFNRYCGSHVGSGQTLLRPPESIQFDFEGELAVVIGTSGRRIPVERALDHVAGYANYNDGTIRDWQFHTDQHTAGKSFARSGGFGPWLVTTDEIPDPSALTLVTRLNGQQMQHAPTSDLVFGVPELIAYLSVITTLEPGDVIITGTPTGVGIFRKPPVWLKPGDILDVEISGLGILRCPVADEIVQGVPS